MLKIKGIIDISMAEWKDHVSTVIFFHGCPLRCKGCQNHHSDFNETSMKKVFENILWIRPFIDSIVISGGEPLYQFEELKRILWFSRKLKLSTAIETSGYYPERLKCLLEDRYLDKVFLDIKGLSNHTGVSNSLENSLNCLNMKHMVDMETRTTLFRTFPDIKMICNAVKPYQIDVLQQGIPEHTKDVPKEEKLTREELLTISTRLGIKTIRTKENGEENVA